MKVGSLFSGIGGIDLGLERAGFHIAWMCEKEPFPRRVLAHHWPSIPIHGDITTLYDPGAVDVLAGGFPCQDISSAGKKVGIDGEKSGLWREYARLIRTVRPRYVIVENVSALLNRGINRVLGDLAEMRYDAEWITLQASDFGAPHKRERLFIVSYPQREGLEEWEVFGSDAIAQLQAIKRTHMGDGGEGSGGAWVSEPRLVRLVYGFPDRVQRITGLGNAVVPQMAQFVGECVKAHAMKAGLWYSNEHRIKN